MLEPNFKEIKQKYLKEKREKLYNKTRRKKERLDPFEVTLPYLFLNLCFLFYPLYLGWVYIDENFDKEMVPLCCIILTVLYFVAPGALVSVYNAIHFDKKLVFTSRKEKKIIRILLRIFNEENISEKEQNILYKSLDTDLVRGILEKVYDKKTGKSFCSLAESGKIQDDKLKAAICSLEKYKKGVWCYGDCFRCRRKTYGG